MCVKPEKKEKRFSDWIIMFLTQDEFPSNDRMKDDIMSQWHVTYQNCRTKTL